MTETNLAPSVPHRVRERRATLEPWRARVASLVVVLATGATAADWPCVRGPDHSGASEETISTSWKGETPPRLWTASVGIGYSSMAVRDGRVVTLGFRDGEKRGDGSDTIWCFAIERGEVLWKRSYPCPKWDSEHAGGPAATPVIDERRVYSLSKEGHLFALDATDGEVVWSRDVRREFDVEHRPSKPRKDYGYTGSPLLVGDRLIVQVGGRNANTVAFDAASGKTVWATGNADGSEGAGYATPVPFLHDDEPRLAVFTLRAFEILATETGRRLARHEWATDFGLNVADPLIDGDRIFISSSYGTGSALLRFDGKGLEEVMRDRRIRCKFVTPALWKGHAYASSDGGILYCVDMRTGETRWRERSVDNASILVAAGQLLILGERGELVIAEASASGYRELRRATIHGGQCWTAPALADGRLLVRNTAGELRCYDLRPK